MTATNEIRQRILFKDTSAPIGGISHPVGARLSVPADIRHRGVHVFVVHDVKNAIMAWQTMLNIAATW